MTDIHNRATRSYNMSRIRAKNTKPEIIARKFLFAQGFRYRLHDKKLPGKPDIVLPKYKTVIFIHGCFWHGHENCRYFTIPKTRTKWWLKKISANIDNGIKAMRTLKKAGWKIFIVWSCQLKSNPEATLKKICNSLNSYPA
jgi:DNA mismatch endonuclease (patch repair protein)